MNDTAYVSSTIPVGRCTYCHRRTSVGLEGVWLQRYTEIG